jgi:hypothetical protein
LASLQTFVLFGVFVRLISQECPVTVAVAVAVTAFSPDVPLAVAMFVVVELIAVALVSVALAPGANGPHEPIEPKWSSLKEPEEVKKSPVFVTTYVYVTDVLALLQTFVLSGVFVKLIEQVWPVTVAVAVAVTAFSSDVPLAVAMFTVVALIAAAFVNVALAPGANGPHEPIEPKWSSLKEPEELKKSPVFVTT